MLKKLDELRRLAEQRLTLNTDDIEALNPQEMHHLFYELRTHQIELEMQNEELHRAQLELQESHARYVELYDFAPAGYLTLNPGGTILEANLTFAGMLSTGRQELIKRPLSTFISPQDQDSYYLFLHKQKKSKVADTLELRFQVGNKKEFWAGLECRPILDEEDELLHFYLIITDISKRKNAEIRLRQAAVVVDNSAEAVLITDTDNRIISVNQAFTDITGYTQQEVEGDNPSILKSFRHDAEFYATMWQTVNQNGRWQGEIWDRRKNGEIFPAWQTITRVLGESGELTNYVSVFSDISTIKQSQAKLDFLAHHDPLTSLPNRILFTDRLSQALRHARREQHKVAVLFVDLDRFKNINDSLGHPVGDKLIQLAGQRIKGVLRDEDTVARLGGDEFIIAMKELYDNQSVAIVANKLVESFQQPFHVDEHELHVSLSMGISFYPQDGEDGETLIKNADAAMYRAKEDGRNKYHFYTEELTTTVFERLAMETALRHALEHDEMEVCYQPQYQVQSGEMIGVEALLRWHHPQKGLLGPSDFIALAEECGLILPLGELALRKACSQMQQWLQRGAGLQHVSVNVSAIQLQRGDFVETVKTVLAETGLATRHLELEITESVIMQEEGCGMETLNQLQSLGISLTIDDFGTGFSSLSYLKRLPVNKLKIDRSFVCDMPGDLNDVAITRAIVALSKTLQFSVIAEGVETQEQLSLLESLGCDEVQGHYFSHAVSADSFGALPGAGK